MLFQWLAERKIQKQLSAWEKVKVKLEKATDTLKAVISKRYTKVAKLQLKILNQEDRITGLNKTIKETDSYVGKMDGIYND